MSGADPVDERPGFADMLKRIAGNGVRTIIVETANRFARDLIVQETGWRFLQRLRRDAHCGRQPRQLFLDTSPTAVLIRQVLGAVSQFEKAALVAKLKAARERKKRETGKCGGRKSYVERDAAMVALAKRLARYPVKAPPLAARRCQRACRTRPRRRIRQTLRRNRRCADDRGVTWRERLQPAGRKWKIISAYV